MTIRIKATGRVVTNAHWLGFNWWARAWLDDGPGNRGWGHWPSSEFEVLES